MRKHALLPLAALLLGIVPASASSLLMREPAWNIRNAEAQDGNGCSLPRLSIRTDSLSLKSESETVAQSPVVDNPWASGATSHWNAGMNRAVDHLLKPPERVNVYATQTGGDLRGHFEGTSSPSKTFAAFEVVIH